MDGGTGTRKPNREEVDRLFEQVCREGEEILRSFEYNQGFYAGKREGMREGIRDGAKKGFGCGLILAGLLSAFSFLYGAYQGYHAERDSNPRVVQVDSNRFPESNLPLMIESEGGR